jgi:thiol-disulfide isomerase/thioredoxin
VSRALAGTVLAATLALGALATVAVHAPLAARPGLGVHDPAPDFAGIARWLNSEPLTIESLRGKVVLVDFWTYDCVNCVRTLPHVTQWFATYEQRGFVVVGVHTPEFAFERETSNVQAALERFGIRYPVAQDNAYATWNAYGNRYWPAQYLLDRNGTIVLTHMGEGDYDELERAIRALLGDGTSERTREVP